MSQHSKRSKKYQIKDNSYLSNKSKAKTGKKKGYNYLIS